MADSRAPYELTLRFGVDADRYDDARALGRAIVEQYDGKGVATVEGGGVIGKVEFLWMQVKRRGAMRP